MDERVVWSHLIQMAEGLNCLHEQAIVHRDLKAANIFLAEDGSVKIGDLNVSKRMKQGNLLRTQIGTPYYMSPEVWLNKPYGMSSDIWALGCLVYELCASRSGQEKGDSTSLQRGCSRSDSREESIHALGSPREMIARPKMSHIERKNDRDMRF